MQKARRLMDEKSGFFFSNVLNSLVFYYTWFRKLNFCVQTKFEQYLAVWVFFSFSYRGNMRRSHKALHKALRSIQFLASFIRFYFEILSYLACGEKIIRLASKNSVKLNENSAGDF